MMKELREIAKVKEDILERIAMVSSGMDELRKRKRVLRKAYRDEDTKHGNMLEKFVTRYDGEWHWDE